MTQGGGLRLPPFFDRDDKTPKKKFRASVDTP
jgi:hypothetical protein